MASPAHQFFTNIVGELEYHNGQAGEITGIVAQGDTLTIQLIEPQGHFLSLLAMPFLCAVPTTLPPVEHFAPISSAGPYYISEHNINQQLISEPESQLPRAASTTLRQARVLLQLERGDGLPAGLVRRSGLRPDSVAHVQEVANLYGPDSPAAARGLQQFFVEPSMCIGMLPDEHVAPDVRDVVEHAEGGQLRGQPHGIRSPTGPSAATPNDQYLPPGEPGFFEDIQVSPDDQNLAFARQLADWRPRDPCGRSPSTTARVARPTRLSTRSSART